MDRPSLAVAVASEERLLVDRRVPSFVHHDAAGGRHQVDSLAACLGRDQEGRAAAGLVLCLVETRAELLPPLAVGRPVQPAVVFRTPAAAAVRRYFADTSPILRRYFGGLLVGFGRVRVGGLGQGPLD